MRLIGAIEPPPSPFDKLGARFGKLGARLDTLGARLNGGIPGDDLMLGPSKRDTRR